MQLLTHRPSVSVIIPTLNEAENLPLVLPYLPLDWVDEVILVDGRSTDGTVQVATGAFAYHKCNSRREAGEKELLYAQGIMPPGEISSSSLDADGSHDREIPRLCRRSHQEPILQRQPLCPGGYYRTCRVLPRFGNRFFVLLSKRSV